MIRDPMPFSTDAEVPIATALALYGFGALGVFLVAAPWTPAWDHVALGLLPGPLGTWVRSGWTRGAVSGVGALDLLAAIPHAASLWRAVRMPAGDQVR
jgi:hypothetical protein